MASLPPQDCCTRGFKHEGTASGQVVELDGIQVYVTGNEANASDRLLIFNTDIFGPLYINSQLIADHFAAKGYYVVIPDLFFKDPIPVDRPADFDIASWRARHSPAITGPIIERFATFITEKYKPKFVATTGYCYGAKYSIRLLGSGVANSAAIFHPSQIDIDEIKAIKGPLYIGAAEVDPVFNSAGRHATEDALLEMKAKYRLTLNHGVSHGFAVRGDISQPWVKYAKERAFYDAVDWFDISYKTL